MGKTKRRDRIVLLLLFGIAAIPVFLGITTARAGEKVIFKIQKDKKKVTEPSKKPPEEVAEAGKIQTESKKAKEEVAYSYDPTNKVDPFKSFIVIKKELEEEREEPRAYLETLDLSQLTVSAIVLTGKGDWALVRDSRGEGHVIKIGTAIGKRRGKVIKILENEVLVREYYKDIRGREIVRDVSMKIPALD